MQLVQNFVRKNFQPLNLTAYIRVDSPDSPLIQSYDAITDNISPDRSKPKNDDDPSYPLVLMPIIELRANDGSMPVPYDNSNLVMGESTHPFNWYANGQPIAKMFTEGRDYDIDTVGAVDGEVNTRGMLTFYANLRRGQEVQIFFEGYVKDKRTGRYVHVIAEPKTLATHERGVDKFTLVITDAPTFAYDPVNDTRLEYEYCKANNIDSDVPETEADDASYLHTWHFDLQQGSRLAKPKLTDDEKKAGKFVEADYSIAVYDKATGEELSVDATDGIIEIEKDHFTIDTRLALNRQYEIVATLTRKADGQRVEVARKLVAYETKYPKIYGTAMVQTGYQPTDTRHSNGVIITAVSQRLRGSNSPQAGRVRYPERLLDISWYGINSLSSDRIFLGEGSNISYDIAKVKVGDSAETDLAKGIASCDYAERCEADWKGPLSLAVDGDGNYLTDENGAILAFN